MSASACLVAALVAFAACTPAALAPRAAPATSCTPATPLDPTDVRRRSDDYVRWLLAEPNRCEWRTLDDFDVRIVPTPARAARQCIALRVSYRQRDRCEALSPTPWWPWRSPPGAPEPAPERVRAWVDCAKARNEAIRGCGADRGPLLAAPNSGFDLFVDLSGHIEQDLEER